MHKAALSLNPNTELKFLMSGDSKRRIYWQQALLGAWCPAPSFMQKIPEQWHWETFQHVVKFNNHTHFCKCTLMLCRISMPRNLITTVFISPAKFNFCCLDAEMPPLTYTKPIRAFLSPDYWWFSWLKSRMLRSSKDDRVCWGYGGEGMMSSCVIRYSGCEKTSALRAEHQLCSLAVSLVQREALGTVGKKQIQFPQEV